MEIKIEYLYPIPTTYNLVLNGAWHCSTSSSFKCTYHWDDKFEIPTNFLWWAKKHYYDTWISYISLLWTYFLLFKSKNDRSIRHLKIHYVIICEKSMCPSVFSALMVVQQKLIQKKRVTCLTILDLPCKIWLSTSLHLLYHLKKCCENQKFQNCNQRGYCNSPNHLDNWSRSN